MLFFTRAHRFLYFAAGLSTCHVTSPLAAPLLLHTSHSPCPPPLRSTVAAKPKPLVLSTSSVLRMLLSPRHHAHHPLPCPSPRRLITNSHVTHAVLVVGWHVTSPTSRAPAASSPPPRLRLTATLDGDVG